MEQCAPVIVLLKLTTERHEASRGLCATAERLVRSAYGDLTMCNMAAVRHIEF